MVREDNAVNSAGLGYDPFGMLLVGRKWGSEEYRYGFNGKENTDEIYGNDNAVDFGARIYDPRLGRWLSIDVLQRKFPELTPYCFAANSPEIIVDLDGNVIEFVSNDQSEQAKQIFQAIYDNADDETKAALDKLKSSDIVYRINVTSNLREIEAGGGDSNADNAITYFNAKESSQTGNITVDIVIELKPDYEITSAMGEELEHARQINEGELGLIDIGTDLISPSEGVFLGGDIHDEVKSKEGAINALKTNNFKLKGDELTFDYILNTKGEAGLTEYLKDSKNGYTGYKNLSTEKLNALGGDSYKEVKKQVKDANAKGFIYRKKTIFGNYKTKIYENKDFEPNKPQGS